MAIVIEEEKRQINWFGVLVVFVILAIISVGSYYLFFINPGSITVVLPPSLRGLEPIRQIRFNPDEVINNPLFKKLKQYVTPIIPEQGFNSNPFR